MKRTLSVLAAAVTATLAAQAAPGNTVDGTVTPGEYSTVLATQNTPTGFGNNLSELNQAFSNYAPGGGLELALTGNLEGNGNGMVIFVDSKAGGAIKNSVPGGYGQIGSVGGQYTDDWGTDTDGSTGVSPTPGGGSILSPNFNPDYAIAINAGGGGANYYVNIIDLTLPNEPSDNRDVYLGGNTTGGPGVAQTYYRDGGATDGGTITHAFNNSNTAGVSDTDASTADTATTGFEFLFSPEFLARDPGHALRLLPFITNGGGDYLSNQFLPGLGGIGNLGGPGGDGGAPLFDSRGFGDQFYLDAFTPTSTATSGAWSAGAFTGGDVPNGTEQAARLTGTSAAALSLDAGGVTLGYLKLDNSAGVTLNGPGALNFDGGAGAAILVTTSGTHTIAADVNAVTDTRIDVADSSAVNFNGALNFAGKSITKAGPGAITLGGAVSAADGNLAVDSGQANINTDLGSGALAAADRPNLYASTPGGGPGATVLLNTSQHLNTLAANPAATVTLAPGGNKVIVTNNVAVDPTSGRLDLTNNAMVVTTTPIGSWTGTAYDGVTGMIAAGRGNGSWNGAGIVTSVAGTNNFTTLGVAKASDALGGTDTDTHTWRGQTVSGSDTLVMFTYGGDANLDGVINIDDYGRIDSNVGLPGASGWYNGDFNYDGAINIDDYGIIDGNIGIQGPPLAGTASLSGVSAVPEPASLALIGLGAAGLVGRRRRRTA